MANAAIFTLSSRFEGLPMVLLEAMTMGMPVVAFDCPTGPGEVISNGHDGLLVPPEDVAALTATMLRLIDDEDLRLRLGDAAMVTSRQYGMDRIGPLWDDLLHELGHS
jgi:glycosyltransferase involved in cell wall biosynthesis